MKQKKMKKLASSVKTEESELKFKAKSSESTNIKAIIKKMTNKFINLILVMRVQSNQIQENSDHTREHPTAIMAEKELELEKFQHISHAFTVENLDTINLKENKWAISELTSFKKKINQESDSDKKYEPLEERTSVNVGTVGEAKNSQKAKIATSHTHVDDDIMEDVELINQKKPEIQNKTVKKQRSRYSATDCLFSQICDSTDANELMGQILNKKVEVSVKKLIDILLKLYQVFFRSG
ncbi:uncharacterized protein CIMG_12997 [Coccidioides immitis RS]|uniref:Uncharacterized protein n=1 Tax=Coccidioides immitis (strain RS) TaxID=246410 RepID=A0A0D8JSZ8_COCIM|nr:uncharacterized protein CIMG_12997 [Coccidioides immitis RS]KJF60475.1 hypothetical protein CIMG_12997 [Coccidioides immitis RS]